MAVNWTTEQMQVISLRDQNILVSAAAGSGKTAVLVERIITRLTKDADPIDVDQLLVVTFTEAAAGEMKERIAQAIDKAAEEHPEDAHLRKQAALVHSARITTIDSFCLSVIREYFHTIDLDPGFRIAEEGELKLLKKDVLKEVLEANYEKGDPEFLQFVETFAQGRTDDELEDLIMQMYEFAGSYPDPSKTLDQWNNAYQIPLSENQELLNYAASQVCSFLEDVRMNLQKAEHLLAQPGAAMKDVNFFAQEKQMLSPLLEIAGENPKGEDYFQRLSQAMGQITSWETIPRKAKDDPGIHAEFKELRDEWKERIKKLQEAYFFTSFAEMEEDMALCRPCMDVMIRLVKEFSEAFQNKKIEKNLIDFRDMEHYALDILTKKTEEGRVPSEVALDYQEQFREVMIDEYQDSNFLQEAILTSVSRMSRGEYNLFMVGDVKQSIYRFRLSRPELFMDKYENYSQEAGPLRRIDLHMNFRSRGEVLRSVNDIFYQIMRKSLGKITYNDEAALYTGALDYGEIAGNETELLILDTSISEEEDAAQEGEQEEILSSRMRTKEEMEARFVALKIKEVMESQRIWDRKAGSFRPCEYRDIVILMRSMTASDIYARVMMDEGIPAYTTSRSGYFETLEIGWILEYLKLLDNFRQDVSLAAVLRSPYVGCTNEELARIKKLAPELSFAQAVLEAKELKEFEKIREFYAQYQEIRKKVPYLSVRELLEELMELQGYREYIAAMPGGQQRRANLDMLLIRAKTYEATSYKGLFHFVRYVEQLKKYEVEYGEAGIYDEQTNAVRMMTIHKSKGLEFPVVILAGLGRSFNKRDQAGSLSIHPELGAGMDVVDLELRTKVPSFLKKIARSQNKLEALGEELRVLYVAMTRAKEKLIMVGTLKGACEKLDKLEEAGPSELSFGQLSSAGCYLDWILPAAVNLGDGASVRYSAVTIPELSALELGQEEKEHVDKEEFLREIAEESSAYAKKDEAFSQKLQKQFAYRYPYQGEEAYKLKYSVSELKLQAAHLAEESQMGEELVPPEEVLPLRPQFLMEEEISGASRGSAYHRVLELIDFTKEYTAASLRDEIAEFAEKGFLDPKMKDVIWIQDILQFLQSSVGRRMKKAAKNGRLFREQPFVLGVDAKEFYGDAPDGELVLIQGIIDVFFEEDGKLILLDYKTDKVTKEVELVDRYQKQLELYKQALERVTGKEVTESLIYSFRLKETIILGGKQC